MGLEKAIAAGKEKRKPYRKSKSFDYSCRNHGGCPWCESNRNVKDRRLAARLRDEVVAVED